MCFYRTKKKQISRLDARENATLWVCTLRKRFSSLSAIVGFICVSCLHSPVKNRLCHWPVLVKSYSFLLKPSLSPPMVCIDFPTRMSTTCPKRLLSVLRLPTKSFIKYLPTRMLSNLKFNRQTVRNKPGPALCPQVPLHPSNQFQRKIRLRPRKQSTLLTP